MDITAIVTVTGRPGLYKVVAKNSNTLIIEDISNGRKVAISSHNRVILLESIGIYTQHGELPLVEVFFKIAKKFNAKNAIQPKSSGAELREFMKNVLPEYDEERVYESHIRKLISWYNFLVEHKIITPESVAAYEEKNESKS